MAFEIVKWTRAEAAERRAELEGEAGAAETERGQVKKGHRGGPGAIAKRLAVAVENGKLTQAEADEKLAALKATAVAAEKKRGQVK